MKETANTPQEECPPSSHSSSSHSSVGNQILKNLIAGGAARGIAAFTLHPFDLIKTRMQFQKLQAHNKHGFYKNSFHALSSIVSSEGPLALYRGLSVRLLYIIPSAAFNFTVYEQFRMAFLGEPDERKTSWIALGVTLALGASARILSTSVRTPFEVVKQQMQVQGIAPVVQKGSGIGATIQHIRENQNTKGLFTGIGVTLLRDLSFSVFYFGSYELFKYLQTKLKRQFTDKSTLPELLVKSALAGAGAAVVGTALTIPIDVVKTRLQTQVQLPPSERVYKNVFVTASLIYHKEGVRAFWRGMGPRLFQSVPAASITFTVFEFIKSLLNKPEG